MSNRGSPENEGWFTSFSRPRPDRCNPRIWASSGGSATRGLPGPARFSSAEVTFAPDHPQLRLLEHAYDKCVVGLDALAQLGARVDRRIDFAAELLHQRVQAGHGVGVGEVVGHQQQIDRSEEHTSELQSLMRISYAVFCLKKKKTP